MDNRIEKYDSPVALIETNCAGQSPRQAPILLCIDWGEGTITAYAAPRIDNSVTAYEWHGHQTTFNLPPHVDASRLREWAEEYVLPHANKIRAGYESVWDGSNHVASFTPEARAVLENLQYSLGDSMGQSASCLPVLDHGGLWDVSEWAREALAGKITADTPDDQLAAMVAELAETAEDEHIVLSGDLAELAEEIRRDKIDGND